MPCCFECNSLHTCGTSRRTRFSFPFPSSRTVTEVGLASGLPCTTKAHNSLHFFTLPTEEYTFFFHHCHAHEELLFACNYFNLGHLYYWHKEIQQRFTIELLFTEIRFITSYLLQRHTSTDQIRWTDFMLLSSAVSALFLVVV